MVVAGALIAGALGGRHLLRRRRRIDLAGASVLITGGSRGLGVALAREFGRHGARVAVCARDEAALERALTDLGHRGIEAMAIQCDLTERRQVANLVETVRERFGGLDVLVNNAGVIQVGRLETMTVEDYQEAMAVNFWAAVYATLEALPLLRGSGGRIVNVSSIGGKLAVPHLLPYSASKFAIGGFSEGLRAELARDGVLVTTVYPGLMRTGSPRHALFKGRHQAEYAWFSISAALPVVATPAERAARAIVDACRHGDAHVVLTLPAKLAALAHGVAPGLVADLLAAVNLLLPAPGGIGACRLTGADSESPWSPPLLTRLGDQAARDHNQVA
jgi:NAD(P)-dependent dehydrogenase (short-subunit alcohol dehydrogenase family)